MTEPTRQRRQIVLASRSPRRRELLDSILPHHPITVQPPTDSREPGFEGMNDWNSIRKQLEDIAVMKYEAVRKALAEASSHTDCIVVAADTAIVAGERDGQLVVLGQPPDDANYAICVDQWFREHLIGRLPVASQDSGRRNGGSISR